MPETSADLLRRAATKIRTTAGAADALGQIADTITTSECPEFADHIAMWHPGIAVLVADWLEFQAEWGMKHESIHGPSNRLARAILGEPA